MLLVRHDSKGPAREVGEAGRGSNAAAGACDILLALRKLGGADSHTRRRLDYAGRFDGIPDARIIEWRADTHTYLSLGTQAEVELSDWKRRLLDVLAAEPVKEADLVEALGTEERRAPRSTVRSALADLVAEGQVIRSGSGRKGSPYLYSAADRPC